MLARQVAADNEILRGVVGSTCHGTAVEGQDDRDEMGIFVEPPEFVCGLTRCEHYVYRDQPEGARSQPGDLDLVMYSLRKFCRLVAIRDAFVSKQSGKRFLGYLADQKKKLKAERAHAAKRPELVARYGYDTKFAMHALRLGIEGIEFMTTRRLTLPVAEPDLTTLRAVRSGKIDYDGALRLIEQVESRLAGLVENCNWEADADRINRFLVEAHLEHWRLNLATAQSGTLP